MEKRFKQAEVAAWIGIIGNIALAILKGVLGTLGNSRALLADAAHSASDVIGSIAVYIGLRAAKRPPDEDHPYGHGKAESIAAIIVAVLLFFVGIEIGKSSIEAFFQPIVTPKWIAIIGAFISILVKEWMFQYKYKLGKKIKSDALIVNAYEHRSDVYSSIAALIGIGSAVMGGKFGIDWLVYADPIAGLIVGLLIIKMAWQLGKESIHTTIDHVLHEENTVHLKKAVQRIEDVKSIDELYAREHGHYLIIDIKVSVDPDMTVEEGHKVGKRVKKQLLKESDVYDVFVHINPYGEPDSEKGDKQ